MKKKDHKRFAPKALGVETVPTGKLFPNPHNPRMLFDYEPLNILQESIDKVGILVPLTVYWSSSKKSYIILDGQRRWICAQKLNLKQVPVNTVREPTLVQNIVTMFQIHKFREDWALMPTALKLELLMRELQEKNDNKLAKLTGLDVAVVRRCKKLLTYPKKYQDRMLDLNPNKRIKADFFIELYAVITDRAVKSMKWFKLVRFTDAMLRKYETKDAGLKAVTDFRKIKQHISNARRASKIKIISRKLREFVEDDSLSIDHLEIRAASVKASASKLEGTIDKLIMDIEGIDTEDYYGEDILWNKLKKLRDIIIKKLVKADRNR